MAGLLDGLAEAGTQTLLAAAQRHAFAAGRVVCWEGDSADALHIIVSGRARAAVITPAGEEATLAVLTQGDVFGELSLLSAAAVHVSTVTALEELETLALRREAFARVRADHPELAGSLIELLALRVRSLSQSLSEALYAPAETRVLRRLLEAAQTYGSGDGTVVPLTQEELGRLAGVVRATANRALQHEQRRGSLRLGRGKITIIDAEQLARSAGALPPAADPPRRPAPQPREPLATEERRFVTLLSAVVDVTPMLKGQTDPEQIEELLSRCGDAARVAVESHGGTAQGLLGDTMVAVFGAPVARGDDAERAVRGALALIAAVAQAASEDDRHRVQVRVGVESGTAMVPVEGAKGHHGLAAGEVLHRSARLRTAAPAGGVLVGEGAYRATRHAVRYQALPASEDSALGAAWLAEAHLPPDRQGLRDSPMLGRNSERDLLVDLWTRAVRERRPRLVTVLGPPGIGKTRLASEFGSQVRNSAGRILLGRSVPYAGHAGYGSFAQQLQAAAAISDTDSPEVANRKLAQTITGLGLGRDAAVLTERLATMLGISAKPRPVDQQTLFLAARQFVEAFCQQQATVFIFEDLHWADSSLLDLVSWLAGRVNDVPAMFLALARPELLDVRSNWGGGLPSFASIELEPLGTDAARQLAELWLPQSARSEAERLAEASGGNPLFVEQLAAAVGERNGELESLPTSVLSAIAARLDVLPVESRQALMAAAVVGKVFWRGAVQHQVAASGIAESLDLLQVRGLIRRQQSSRFAGDVEYLFQHMLIRDAAYDRLPRAERRSLHLRAADWVEAAAGARSEEFVDLLAHHTLQAGQRERALGYLDRAAAQAHRVAAHQEEASLLAQAIPLAQELGRESLVPDLRAKRARALGAVTAWDEARREFEVALSELPPSRSADRAALLVELANACHWVVPGDVPSLRRYVKEGRQLADATGRTDIVAESLAVEALGDSSDGRLEMSLRGFEAALRRAPPARTVLLARGLELHALILYWTGRLDQSVATAEEAVVLGRELNDSYTAMRALSNLALALGGRGRYAEATRIFEDARRFAEEHGLRQWLARSVAMNGGLYLELFDYPRAEALAEEARELGLSAGFASAEVSGGIDLMLNFARRGDPDRAQALVGKLTEPIERSSGAHGWLWRLRFAQARAEAALATGDGNAAIALATDALERATARGRPKYRVAALITRGTALADQLRIEQGLVDLRGAVALARDSGDPMLFIRGASALSRVESADRVIEDARRAVQSVAAVIPGEESRNRFLGSATVRQVLDVHG